LYGQALSKVVRYFITTIGRYWKKYRRDVCKMRNIIKKLKADDIGDMGIGAMIVFIAMVLVAGIAASVLIQTANRLEIQAQQTGQETIGEVSTGLAVTEITGYRGTNDTNLTLMAITIQPRSGSYSIDLNQTYVEVSDSDNKVVLRYDPANTTFVLQDDIGGDLFAAAHYPATGKNFGIVVLEDPRHSLSATYPVIKKGGKVMITINVGEIFGVDGLATRKDIWGLIQPEEGAAGVFAFTTPPSYPTSKNVYALY
jgi:flagellin FlaB